MKTLLIMLAALYVLSACNTMEGFGKDLEKLGSKIEEKAKR